eukprot:COSAG06_NODE_966_length_11290_cov_4.010097_5_plen_125_part_00
MAGGIQSIVALDIGEIEQAAAYFETGYKVFARPPFYTWHEGNDTDGSAGQGAPNLVTAAGGFLQNVWAGYGGVRYAPLDMHLLMFSQLGYRENWLQVYLRRTQNSAMSLLHNGLIPSVILQVGA